MSSNSKTQGFAAVSLVRQDPGMAALVSKVVRDPRAARIRDSEGNRGTNLPQTGVFQQSSQRRAKKNADAKMLLTLLPDLELGIQILTSSILAPGDMMSTELIYASPEDIFTSQLSTTLIDKIKTYFAQDYRIAPLLPTILRKIIAEKGSYPVAVLPENAIDEMINGRVAISTESLRPYTEKNGTFKSLGILGRSTEQRSSSLLFSLESLNAGSTYGEEDYKLHVETAGNRTQYERVDHVVITDNPSTLKMPALHRKAKSMVTRKRLMTGMSLESHRKTVSDQQIENVLYRPRALKHEQVASVRSQTDMNRGSVGRPLIMPLPSEAVLPVHVPGSPSDHVGYFVILDEEGNPLGSQSTQAEHYAAMAAGMENNGRNSSLSSNIIQRVGANFGVSQFSAQSQAHLDYAAQIYGDMIERDLIARIKNGVHSTTVNVARNEEIYRVMLARTLSQKFTQLLYVPTEYMTYMAFKYSDDGVGKSMLDDLTTVNTLRVVVMFADVIASVKNSIGRTSVDITLDDKDPNPLKTLEMVQDDTVRTRQLAPPNSVQSPSDVIDWINRAGYEWHVKNHPGVPDMDIKFDQLQSQNVRPDSDLSDTLRKQSSFGLGIPTEMIDSGLSNAEFATTVAKNNILFSKRILQHQEAFEPHLADHLRKVLRFDQGFHDEMLELVTKNMDEVLYEIDPERNEAVMALPEAERTKILAKKALEDFLDHFTVTLPRPGNVSLQSQVEEFNSYKDGLDVMIDAYISSETFTDATVGGLSTHVDTIRSMLKAHYLRKFMAEKGIMTELGEIININEDDEKRHVILEEEAHHIENMARFAVRTIAMLKPISEAATKDLEKMNTPAGEPVEDTSSDVDTGGSDEAGDAGFGAPEDTTAETPTDDTPEPTSTPDEEESDPQPDM